MTQPTTGKYAERIAKGAALLDKKVPGWRQRIDLGKLNIRWPGDCVIGQLIAGLPYYRVLEDWFGRDGTWERGIEHGFEWDSAAGDDDVELTAAWRQYIEATR
jgi:hypothetical protein